MFQLLYNNIIIDPVTALLKSVYFSRLGCFLIGMTFSRLSCGHRGSSGPPMSTNNYRKSGGEVKQI